MTGVVDADGHRREAVEAWAASGAMALTGRADAPGLGPPGRLVDHVRDLAARLARASAAVGHRVEVDGLDLLVQRAAIAGLTRQGPVSCGGATRLLPAAEGWLAVALPRPDDVDLVGAWLERDDLALDVDPWPAVTDAVGRGSSSALAGRAAWLGLAVSVLGERLVWCDELDERRAAPEAGSGPPMGIDDPPAGPAGSDDDARGVRFALLAGIGTTPGRIDGCRVLDLSSLWAGPLCGQLLVRAGADVVKVESSRRPDGSRAGPPRFFDLLHAGQRSVALDLGDPGDVARLHRLVGAADIVIEASRPRALAQLGLDPLAVGAAGPQVWISITGYGRTGDDAGRVGFGDDTAVAGGLVVFEDDQPRFCADAVADPLAGLAAAGAALEALGRGGRWLVDVPLASVAAAGAGPTLAAPADVVVADPPVPAPTAAGPRLGQHTGAVLADWGAEP